YLNTVLHKLISNLADIYYLKEEQLIPLPRLGQKSAKKIITQIAESKCRGLSNFLTGLGIPLVGHKTARDIASHFGNIERIISASQSELESVNGVGEEIALSVMKYFSQPSTKDMVKRFDSAGVKMFQDNELKSETLSGRKFVLTGTLVNYSRDEMKKIIESNGGIVVGSVSGKTDYVIAGENSGSKMDKAAQLNIKVLTEGEFFELLGN
ncbi:MAG: NAD-dependent DNA ligase LigA, partial [Candidatus Moranbacteria bacterium]|nr:NAD-dependent DNA ligase LigA [Candidatus Moranbacteria bacterium]